MSGLGTIFKLAVVVKLADQLSSGASAILRKINDVTQATKRMDVALKALKWGAGLTAGAAAVGGALIKSTIETGRALGELSSVGVKDLQAIDRAAQSFANEWAGSTKPQFISAAYDIKSGISTLSDEGVADFTRLAALTAKATKASVGEMTSLFATGYGIYKEIYAGMSDLQFGEVFSAGIAASVKQFKTTGPKMATAVSTLGAAATKANVPFTEQMAILGMLQGTMRSGETTGTAYAAFIRDTARAGERLGLNFLDANNQLKSMPEVLEVLRGKFGETIDATERLQLQKAFTDESLKVIELLYSRTGELTGNIDTLNTAINQGSDFTAAM
ncbi:MAG: phage tail tape measure protein, partial [Deltaproteobacteria bacterium]|nr:phage tail tape measure protein [Deltaproteobacteria bacterium]